MTDKTQGITPFKHRLLLLLANFVVGLYVGYLWNYRWGGIGIGDTLVPHIFTQTNLLFSLWFVAFLVIDFVIIQRLIKSFGWFKPTAKEE